MRRRLLSELGMRVRMKLRLSAGVAVCHQVRMIALKGGVQVLKIWLRRLEAVGDSVMKVVGSSGWWVAFRA